MPSHDIDENEGAPARPRKTNTPQRSPAVRRPANATPTRKAAAYKAGTPNSAPARTKAGAKKAEPTLFTDFLLGRPSVTRARGKTIDVIPMEMKRSAVGRVQPPGGVKERVKQWQKASAAAVVEDSLDPPSEPDDISLRLDDQSVTEEDRRKIKFRKNHTHKPGRRKSNDKDNPTTPMKSVTSPKKRVVSDDHWVISREKISPQLTHKVLPVTLSKAQTLPKDFVKNSANLPLEKKIEDWNKRTIPGEGDYNDNRERKESNSSSKVGGQKPTPSRSRSPNSRNRVRPLKERPVISSDVEKDIEIQGKQVRRNGKQGNADHKLPKQRNEKHEEPPPVIRGLSNSKDTIPMVLGHDGESNGFCRMPTHSPRTKNRHQKSASPESLADIPVGYSAFSVLDVPVGDSATIIRPSKPQRQASLSAVPKALKKVYTEGMRKMQDVVDHPRTGVNQPPSIESWLRGTSDPFIDETSNSESKFRISKPNLQQSSAGLGTAHHVNTTHEKTDYDNNIGQQPRNGTLKSHHDDEENAAPCQAREVPVEDRLPIEREIGEGETQPRTPIGLKRSPAARHTSPPKPVRHATPKNVAIDLQNGHSQTDLTGSSPGFSVRDSKSSSEMRGYSHAFDTEAEELSSPQSLRTVENSDPNSRDMFDPNLCSNTSNGYRVTTRLRRLSTIASVETLPTASAPTTSSECSDTTFTKSSVTKYTSKSSYTSNALQTLIKVPDQRNAKLGLKRGLTKHSDLLSVLSLSDSTVPGRTKSIRSARTIRTARTRLDTATIKDLLRELADDEVKYMRELKALVDGVVPVLLGCVLSKADTAATNSLFGRSSNGKTDAYITKPIVDMGVALEQMKSFHKRIPLHDSELLLQWASGVHKVYEDYVDAWRMGFQNVIVNLAPAPQLNLAEEQSLDEMPRNEDGDVLNENGERVDVAFLLKRPLVRVKYLAKMIKGIYMSKPLDQAAKVNDQYQALLIKIRRRIREEEARLEDQAACSTDATRARDPRTLNPLENVMIDTTRQVYAKDFFDFGLSHCTGQRIDCRVELLFRDKPQDKSDVGDVLICEVDSISRWLLFPPIELSRISARAGDAPEELLVMIRGTEGTASWHELFILKSADKETAVEWLQMLGLSPKPPDFEHVDASSTTLLSLPPLKSGGFLPNGPTTMKSTLLDLGGADIPIGERRTKGIGFPPSKLPQGKQRAVSTDSHTLSPQYATHAEIGDAKFYEEKPADLNDAMCRAGRTASSELRRPKAERHQSHNFPQSPVIPASDFQGINGSRPEPKVVSFRDENSDTSHADNIDAINAKLHPSKLLLAGMPPISKHRKDETFLPPAHQILNPISSKSPAAVLEKSSAISKTRRTSSPLKHEYQPSGTPEISSGSDSSESGEFGDSSDSSEEELEAADLPLPNPGSARPRKKVSPAGSLYSLPSASLAPSNSASQITCEGAHVGSNIKTTKVVARLSCWSDKGSWVDLHPQDCTVAVSPGLIEAFVSFEAYGSDGAFSTSSSADVNTDKEARIKRPLVSLELTPIVPLRQSNAVDIEIRSPPTAKSSVECTHTVRFRSRTLQECSTLYSAIHKARMENPVYMKLEQERIVNAYGKELLEETAGSNRRRSWFGRSKSYRASNRAPSDIVSENSTNSIASAISRLRNIGILGSFNIDKSSVGRSQEGLSGTSSGATSVYTGSTNSASSRTTPPGTPSSPSTAMTGATDVASFGSSDLKIRLYLNVTPSKWSDLGSAFLTVTHPPRGMRQASSLYHGVEKRIIVTKKQSTKRTLSEKFQASGSPKTEELGALEVILDVILGGACFSRQGVVGIAMNVWEDIKGDDGEVGKVAAIGGVSGRTRRWMFHFANAAETAWVFSLVGGGMR